MCVTVKSLSENTIIEVFFYSFQKCWSEWMNISIPSNCVNTKAAFTGEQSLAFWRQSYLQCAEPSPNTSSNWFDFRVVWPWVAVVTWPFVCVFSQCSVCVHMCDHSTSCLILDRNRFFFLLSAVDKLGYWNKLDWFS